MELIQYRGLDPLAADNDPSSVVGQTREGLPYDQRRRCAVPVQLCVVGVFRTPLLQGRADGDQEEDAVDRR